MLENPKKSIIFHGCFDGNHPKSSELRHINVNEKMHFGESRDGCMESMVTAWAKLTHGK